MKQFECCLAECPQQGDVYVCPDCSMTLLVVKGCSCKDCQCVALACCGKTMAKANQIHGSPADPDTMQPAPSRTMQKGNPNRLTP